jgi:GNAT superfamily N-acetyltransferase
MLVEGFDRVSTMALIYNHPYYPEHMKKHGYVKETGWLEYRITIPDELPEKHIKIAEIVKERYNLSVVKKTKRQIRKEKYGHKLFRLINETYCVLYGYSLLSEKQIDQYVDVYLGLVDMEMLTFIEDSEGELIGAGITIPSMAEALQKCNGEIFPFGWYHLLKSMYWGKPDTLDMLLIGVKPEWQNKGVNSLLFVDLFQRYKKMGFKYAETNANLETNAKVQAMWTPFEREQHKKRWVFGKGI